MDRGGLYYAQPDGSSVTEVVHGLLGANGVGLSPDGGTVYVAETNTGRLWAWEVTGPGQVAEPRRCVVATPASFDSLAVEADGHVVVAAITEGICVVDPATGEHELFEMPDPLVTNICFTGEDHCTAYITLSGAGWLGRTTWPRPGLPLEH
jgi:gluconolactonase